MAKKRNSCADDYLLFDRTIRLQTATITRDPFGGEVKTWTSEDIPAAIEPELNKTEVMPINSKEHALTSIIFTIRYRSNLTEKQQILFENNDYDILGITEVPRRKYTRIAAVLRR